jgi:hypothetical protein
MIFTNDFGSINLINYNEEKSYQLLPKNTE